MQKRPKSKPTAVPEHELGTLLEAYKTYFTQHSVLP
jgi:hypothetical protein